MILQISASAGSGKTYALTRRFLALLAEAEPHVAARGCAVRRKGASYSLQEILAATFTNKAAAEMKDRVLRTLKERAIAGENKKAGKAEPGISSSRAAEEWVERVLRHYGSLNIRTIDSLLAALVRLSALQLGLAPDFQPGFSSAEYFTPLYDALMEDLKEAAPEAERQEPLFFSGCDAASLRAAVEKGCASLLSLTDFKGFTPRRRLHDLVLELVNRLLEGKETPDMDSGAIYARLTQLHAAYAGSAQQLLRVLGEQGLSVNANYLKYLDKCSSLERLCAPPSSAYADKQSLDACLNKASQGKASAEAEAAFMAFAQAQQSYPGSLSLFRHALQLAPLVALAKEIYCRMREGWAENALIPALRLPYFAGQVLSGEYGVSDALCRMGSRLSQILLDEFQDTSQEQWDAIRPLAAESLASGGSLTYVGDVKQAIYGWRGGDARLFDKAPHEPELKAIAPEGPATQRLPCNWRSSPAIVRHNNAFFSLLADPAIARQCLAAMLPAKSPPHWIDRAAKDAARYFRDARQELPAGRDWERDPANRAAEVRIYTVAGETAASVVDCVRRRLRRLLLEELLETWRPGQIALLVQSNAEAGLLAEWLTDWGVPVVAENSFLLAAHPLVGRLISFLSFLDYPLDDLAFWEFVSGPECLGAAVRLHARENGLPPPCLPGPDWPAEKILRHKEKRPPLHQLFRKEYPDLWDNWIAPFFNEAGLMSAYDTLKEILRKYRTLETSPDQAPFLLRLLELAHLAEARGHSSLAAFLSFWEGCSQDEKLPLADNMDAVRIMTVHKAKGLEFPVVILPFQHKGRRREPGLTVAEVQGLRILTRAEEGLEEEHYSALIMNELERLNLLYVSWTRPIYALHAFVTRPKAPTPLSKALEVLVEHYRPIAPLEPGAWEDLNADENAGIEEDEQAAACEGEDAASTTQDERGEGSRKDDAPASAWRPMDWLPRLKIYRSTLESAQLTPRRRGILAHLCLEHLTLSQPAPCPEPGGEEVERALLQDVRRAVRQGMRLFPMPLEGPEEAAREMEECLFWFVRLPEARLWLSKGKREQAVIDRSGGLHRVDLLVDASVEGHEDNAPLRAVDYKTGLYPEAALAGEHHDQVRRYMRLLKEASGRPVFGSLVYLDARIVEEVTLEGA